jgi:hypothetical protein
MDIISDICSGIDNRRNLYINPDRKECIEYAILNMKKNDVLLVAGKGHEDYMIIKDEKIYFSDKTITNCEFILTGNFSRIKPKYLPEKYIPDSVARVTDIDAKINELKRMIESLCVRKVTITLLSSAWVVDGDRYAQIVSIPEATAYSKVDLQPSAEQLTIFHEKDIAFVTENVGGTITVYCIGQKPTNDYTIQATITEVSK